MTSLFNKDYLSDLKSSELVEHYNYIAHAIGIKLVKKFRDKATAISRCLKIQIQGEEWKKIQQLNLEKSDTKKEIPVKVNGNKSAKSIKTLVLEMFEDNYEDKVIIDIIKDNHPNSKFNQDHVSWYRSTMFRDGIIGPSQAPRRSKAYKNWLAEQK